MHRGPAIEDSRAGAQDPRGGGGKFWAGVSEASALSGAAGALSYTIPEALGISTDVAGVMPWSIAAIVGVSGVGFVVGLVGLVCSVAGEGPGE